MSARRSTASRANQGLCIGSISKFVKGMVKAGLGLWSIYLSSHLILPDLFQSVPGSLSVPVVTHCSFSSSAGAFALDHDFASLPFSSSSLNVRTTFFSPTRPRGHPIVRDDRRMLQAFTAGRADQPTFLLACHAMPFPFLTPSMRALNNLMTARIGMRSKSTEVRTDRKGIDPTHSGNKEGGKSEGPSFKPHKRKTASCKKAIQE